MQTKFNQQNSTAGVVEGRSISSGGHPAQHNKRRRPGSFSICALHAHATRRLRLSHESGVIQIQPPEPGGGIGQPAKGHGFHSAQSCPPGAVDRGRRSTPAQNSRATAPRADGRWRRDTLSPDAGGLPRGHDASLANSIPPVSFPADHRCVLRQRTHGAGAQPKAASMRLARSATKPAERDETEQRRPHPQRGKTGVVNLAKGYCASTGCSASPASNPTGTASVASSSHRRRRGSSTTAQSINTRISPPAAATATVCPRPAPRSRNRRPQPSQVPLAGNNAARSRGFGRAPVGPRGTRATARRTQGSTAVSRRQSTSGPPHASAMVRPLQPGEKRPRHPPR